MSNENTANEKKNTRELLRALKFTLISISAGLIQALSFTLLNEVAGIGAPEISHLIALVLSVVWNFTINRKYTFKSSANLKRSMLLVALFYVVFTPASTLFTRFATDAGLNEYLVEGINMLTNFVLEYLFTRFVIYRTTCDTAEK